MGWGRKQKAPDFPRILGLGSFYQQQELMRRLAAAVNVVMM
tara:strand:- start:22 stop:144 length:123 start_codon:yes stop_codon:yes gene_type:complete